MYSTTKYLGVTVTHGDEDRYLVQIYHAAKPEDVLDLRVCDIVEANAIVSAVVRTHDSRLAHSQTELEATIYTQLINLANDPTLRAAMWLPPEAIDITN